MSPSMSARSMSSALDAMSALAPVALVVFVACVPCAQTAGLPTAIVWPESWKPLGLNSLNTPAPLFRKRRVGNCPPKAPP